MARSPKHVPTEIRAEKFLKGMDYPASKDEICQCASSNRAPNEILSALEGLPEREYGGPADVSKGLNGD